MIAYLVVALGGALGSVARYALGLAASSAWGEAFPWGTILINIIGSFIIGYYAMLSLPNGPLPGSADLRLFILVGICGGFTTFSSFSLQTLMLLRGGNPWGAAANIVLSVAICLLAVGLGTALGRRPPMRLLDRGRPAILAVLDRAETAPAVLRVAASLRGRFAAQRLVVLRPSADAGAGFLPTEEVTTAQDAQEIAAQARARAADLHGLFTTWRNGGVPAEWQDIAGPIGPALHNIGRPARLVVLGHAADPASADLRATRHAAIFAATAPVLLVPPGTPAELGRCIAIGGKPSAATTRAIDAAWPLLRGAAEVMVLLATEPGEPIGEPASLLARLRTAGVPARTTRFAPGEQPIGVALADQALAEGADLLVMGAFTHGRLREALLGGATRDILGGCKLPVLLHA